MRTICFPTTSGTLAILCVLLSQTICLCRGDASIKKTVLAEKPHWLDPSDPLRKYQTEEPDPSEISNTAASQSPAPGDESVDEDERECKKSLSVCESSLAMCDAHLARHRMATDVTDAGRLPVDFVYFRQLVAAMLAHVTDTTQHFEDNGYDAAGKFKRIELTFTTEDIAELHELLRNFGTRSAGEISSKMSELVAAGRVSSKNRTAPSYFRRILESVWSLMPDIWLPSIPLSMWLFAAGFVVLRATSRVRARTGGFCLMFLLIVSYFWYWANLIRKSEADRHLMNRMNPCGEGQPWYYPTSYFKSSEKECQEFLRKQFTPSQWEFTPLEVLVLLISDLFSTGISTFLIKLLGSLGVAIQKFADSQSWFSVVPAFVLLFAILLIVVFKASGMTLSVFGVRLEQAQQHFQPLPATGRTYNSQPEIPDNDQPAAGYIEDRAAAQTNRLAERDSSSMLPPSSIPVSTSPDGLPNREHGQRDKWKQPRARVTSGRKKTLSLLVARHDDDDEDYASAVEGEEYVQRANLNRRASWQGPALPSATQSDSSVFTFKTI